jgi:cytochrome c peroxidase
MERVGSMLLFTAAACGAGSSSLPPPASHGDSGASSLRMPELGPVPPLPSFLPDDPVTPDKVQLGKDIYFDVRLSGSGHTNCDACHIHNTGFQDNLNLSTPDRSYPSDSPTLTRNTLSFLNIVYAPVFRWDGSHTDMVAVMAFPLAEPNMNIAKLPTGDQADDVPLAQQALYAKVTSEIPGYAPLYQRAFASDIRGLAPADVWSLTGRALRAFVSQAVSRDAPFDRWNGGDDSAMDASALNGLAVFRGAGRCILCHTGPFFTDFGFHNLSTSPPRADGTRADEGRYLVTARPQDRGAFLTPTLRQAYDTAPYFHDGSRQGLRDVLDHLASPAVTADPNHDAAFDTPLVLGENDVSDLISFLKALRGKPITGIVPPAPGELP